MSKLKLGLTITTALIITSCSHAPLRPKKVPNSSTVVEQDGDFDVIPLFGKFNAKRATLDNGLRVVLIADHASPTFAYQTWFDVGSMHEVPGKTGLAHLFEHMTFKGTSNHPDGEFDRLLEQAGADDQNAHTSTDQTVYEEELPIDALDMMIGLEADRMTHLIVDDQAFKTEREVVQNERRFRKENSAEGQMYEELFNTAYTQHPYHWPVIGYEQDLNVMNAADARAFYEQFYSPDRATIVIVGDINENAVLKKIKKAYGSIPAKPKFNPVITPEPEQTAQRRKRMSLNLETEKLWLAFKIPGSTDPINPVLEVIQALLSDGKNSRLNRALVDSGIASGAGAGSLGLKDPGLYMIEATLQKGKSSTLAEAVILRELERLKNSPIGDEELKRAKSLLEFSQLQHLSTAKGLASAMGSYESELGSLELGLDLYQRTASVTAEEIQKVAKQIFNTSKMTVITGVPKSK